MTVLVTPVVYVITDRTPFTLGVALIGWMPRCREWGVTEHFYLDGDITISMVYVSAVSTSESCL